MNADVEAIRRMYAESNDTFIATVTARQDVRFLLDRLAAAERVVEDLRAALGDMIRDTIPGSQSPRQETYDRAVAFLGSEKAYSGGTSTDHVVPAGGSGQEMLALRPDAAPNMSHRRDTSDPNRLADETSGPDDLDAYLERRKRTDLNSEPPVETPPMPAPTPQTHPYKRTDLMVSALPEPETT